MDQGENRVNRRNSGWKNPDDFHNDYCTSTNIVYLFFYERQSVDIIAEAMKIPEERIFRFIDALSYDPFMQDKYDMKQVLWGRNNRYFKDSFEKRDMLSHNEDYYGNIPKKSLKLGWLCPEGY